MQNIRHTFHIGINIIVVKDGKLLLGKRKNIYGAGTWGLPGGHLEEGEAMIEAAVRELKEETGMDAIALVFSNLVNDRSRSDRQYLQIGFVAEEFAGDPIVNEPDRCEEWNWFELKVLPHNMFPPHIKQIENYLNRRNFIDA